MEHYDCVIIGGGVSGLYAGALLSRKGKKVIILEQYLAIGGHLAGFTRKGFYFDSSIARFIATSTRGYYEALGLWEKLDFRPCRAALNIEGTMYFPANTAEVFKAYGAAFPEHKDNLARLYQDWVKAPAELLVINSTLGAFSYTGMKLFGKMLQTLGQAARAGVFPILLQMNRYMNTPAEAVVKKYIPENTKLYTLLTGAGGFNLFNKGGNTSLMTFAGDYPANYSLNLYPYQGFQAMSAAIAEVARKAGAEIITGARVTRIVVADGRAQGVEYTCSGKTMTVQAESIVHAADLVKAYRELLPREASEPEFVARLVKQETTSPIMIMYLGLKLGRQMVAERFGQKYEVICFPNVLPGNEKIAEQDFFKYAPFIVHCSTQINPAHSPPGKCGLQLYLTCPPPGWMNNWGIVDGKRTDTYRQLKNEAISAVLQNLETVLPEIRDRSIIEVCELGTPFTIERFTGNTHGAHCGFTWDGSKNEINPPMGKFNLTHARIKNLYFIGHWTGFMGGVTNALGSARELCGRIA